jgi:rod shape-determining protein MreD
VSIFGIKPDLLLIFIVFFGLFLGWETGLESGIIAGFLKDIFTFYNFGVNAFIFGLMGFLAGILNTKFFKESKTTQIFLVLFFAVFSKFFLAGWHECLLTYILPAGIYTALVSIPIFSKLIVVYGLKEHEDFL